MAGSQIPAAAPSATNAPPGPDTITATIRLGWYLAELRGRYWWQGPRPRAIALPVDPPHALPLRPERTAGETRQQARETVVALARRLGVDEPFDLGGGAVGAPFSEQLAKVVVDLDADDGTLLGPVPTTGPDGQPRSDDEKREDAEKRDEKWGEVAGLLHEWDASIQDCFAARADVQANAYLLGRGLAECYWAMGPDHPARGSLQEGVPAASGWQFLFGDARRGELSRLVGRVAAHVNALTPSAVAGSIEAWGAVAADAGWRETADSEAKLYEQLRRWYELLVLGRDPTTYVRPYAVLRGWRTTKHAFTAFWPQLALAAASAVAVTLLVWFLTTGQGSAALNVLLGLAGGVGLTAASVVAKAKSAGQRLLARLRQDAYSDLVAIAVTSIPNRPGEGEKTTERRTREAVAGRRLTPVTPLLDTTVPPL